MYKEQKEIRFVLEADNGLNGVNVSWNFPDMPSIDDVSLRRLYLS